MSIIRNEHGGQRLSMWVIYERPKDYPDGFVVRRQSAVPGGQILIDRVAQYAPDLETARRLVPPGLVMLTRNAEDDPVIVETWL